MRDVNEIGQEENGGRVYCIIYRGHSSDSC